ncbi:MAG: hypothetical protein ABFS56_35405 [Pseudomonadota bacterium]
MNDELKQVAQRVNWFEPPEKVVQDVDRFLVYFMQYCLDTDIPVMRRYFTNQQFRQALDNRSPGIMDERSVAYWDLVLPQYSGKKNPSCFPK